MQEKKGFFHKVRLTSYEAKGKAIEAARAAKASLKDLNLPKQTSLYFANKQSLPDDYLTAPIFVNEVVSETKKFNLQSGTRKRRLSGHTSTRYVSAKQEKQKQQSQTVRLSWICWPTEASLRLTTPQKNQCPTMKHKDVVKKTTIVTMYQNTTYQHTRPEKTNEISRFFPRNAALMPRYRHHHAE